MLLPARSAYAPFVPASLDPDLRSATPRAAVGRTDIDTERFRAGLSIAIGAVTWLCLYAALQLAHAALDWPAAAPLPTLLSIPYFWRIAAGGAGALLVAALCYSANTPLRRRIAGALPHLLMASIVATTVVTAFAP